MSSFYQLRQAPSFSADPLSCHEEDIFPFREEEEEQNRRHEGYPSPAIVAEDAGDLLWEWGWDGDGGEEERAELAALLSKQAATGGSTDPSLFSTRDDAVRWLLRASGRHGFTTQTALLAVDYLDRFLFATRSGGGAATHQQQQPWMAQLSAVSCLSLAAKMEEIRVPLLLDLQVEDARFIFEARTVQRMELLVLSTLGWRLGSPTPLSFIDHFLRRLAAGDKAASPSSSWKRRYAHLHWKFQASCHSILLYLAADPRWLQFLPSEVAAATMIHALGRLLDHPLCAVNLQSRLMDLAGVTKDRFEACSEFIGGAAGYWNGKRRRSSPGSPRGVAEVTFSCDSSQAPSAPGSVSSSPTMPPAEAPFKRRLHSLVAGEDEQSRRRPLLDGVFV
ncbi:unnamed protein product [Spirodela intermedia]|uniref:Uncharacterized protein n=1 Tax=Spirodela intermedia TaxID=51605 RepID=A0A7I8LCR9_SPIIN|nr:unnamed protein product [Spirodela intermedia]